MNGKPALSGKTALVTGGSRGIGAEVARRLGAEDAAIAIAYRSDKASADRVVEDLKAAGARACAFAADISCPEDCERLVRECIEIFGRLDILVNAAGVATYRPLEQADADHYHAMFATNVLGALSVTRAVATVMETPGRIVHFSSRLAESPMPGTSVYAASKAAVSALTLALSQELGPRGITINAIAPGLIETDMTAAAVRERGDAMRSRTPLRRIGQPGDISGLVAFLASDDAGWITGRTIRADGGLL
ncbi:SDR family NAD(P)-dependent oxidoreductase [Paracoccus onubensis]|uniref:Glucose 1-dehydrogenase n=1 Tax=Paracoccus onubensis TaxID=1675788 RepID=A0A418T7F3_9RHOB|nr:glucose 1-dehydrogenase [Paracoccus onubensis]RJE89127.1 glucose 1-dehydrogenase [Paracoccus onubensis]